MLLLVEIFMFVWLGLSSVYARCLGTIWRASPLGCSLHHLVGIEWLQCEEWCWVAGLSAGPFIRVCPADHCVPCPAPGTDQLMGDPALFVNLPLVN